MILRENTIPVRVGHLIIGHSREVLIQSMTNTKTEDAVTTLKQINELSSAGVQLVRLAVQNKVALNSLNEIVINSPVPIVADIHFDHKLALGAIEAGVAKIRLNPGNISSRAKLKEIIEAAKKKDIAIRIGVNTGSVGETVDRFKKALFLMDEYLEYFEECKFSNIVVSLKSSNIRSTITLNENFAKNHKYPLHLGITEAGFGQEAIIKSSIGIGSLLAKGIGNTIRVSMTGDPVQEVFAAKSILKAVGLFDSGVNIISCPTCGRTDIDVEKLAKEISIATSDIKEKLTIAVMGCVVNGPGEAMDADYGISGGKESGVIFAKGKIVKKVPEGHLVEELLNIIKNTETISDSV